jgi:hypothetical protein
MDKRVLDYDPLSKVCTWFEYNDATDETTISYTGGDAKEKSETSQMLQNDENYTRQGMKNEFVHYAHISDAQLLRWHCEGIDIKDHKQLFAMVNKPEYRKLKTTTLVHKPKG